MPTTQQDLHQLRSILTPRGAARVKDPDLVDKEKDKIVRALRRLK